MGGGVKNNVSYDELTQTVSERKNINKQPRDHSCDILANTVSTFCSCPKNLHEVKLRFGLMKLTGEISRQPSIKYLVWFLVITVMQIYNNRRNLDEEKYKTVQFEEKNSTRKYNGVKSSAKGNTVFKEKSNSKWDKYCGDLRSRPHPAKFTTCEKELKEKLSSKVMGYQTRRPVDGVCNQPMREKRVENGKELEILSVL